MYGRTRARKSRQIRVHPLFVEYAKRVYSEENSMYDITKKIAENQERMLYGKKTKK